MQNRKRAQSAITGGVKNSLTALSFSMKKRTFYRAVIKQGLTAQLA